MSSRTAEAPLRLLHLEDSELDHALTLAHLKRGGLCVEAKRVDSEALKLKYPEIYAEVLKTSAQRTLIVRPAKQD